MKARVGLLPLVLRGTQGSLLALMPRGHTWQMIDDCVLAASMSREVLTCHRRTGADSIK
jgi:hypothetical protein